ncbi:HNH endonuclease [Bacillus infantis]|uniref:HNH endonuclease n=1 Tax=Bacillus infantis TaxID=324767 RepID=UPI003CFA62F3
MHCYVCDEEITSNNETEEHILLNAIGGKLKSKKLICIGCNSKLGSNIDDKLAEQLNPIGNLLDIKRDRGKPQNVIGTYNNKDIIIEPGGALRLKRAYTEKGDDSYHIEASSVRQARQALEGLKRKHPHIDVDEQIKNAKRNKSYLPSVTISTNFGGQETKRALCKMAVNFYIYNGGNPATVKHLLPFIEGKKEEAEVYYFYPMSEVFYKNERKSFTL